MWVAPANHPSLYTRSLTTSTFNWIWPHPPEAVYGGAGGMKAKVKVRHAGRDLGAFVHASSPQSLKIIFDTPEKAVAPGQIVVVYDETGVWCLGCGVIDDTECLA